MKRLKNLLNGVVALFTVLLFAQCAGKAETNTAVESNDAKGSLQMKIAYVEIDTLLTQYNYWNDLNEVMMKKGEDVRATLNQKARELENEVQEFQRKIQNNAFMSRERAEQENNRLMKKQMDLQELQNKLGQELATEEQKNALQLRDSINSFLQEYNKDKGYSLIISNTGFDNLLYADKAYDITQEIVEGLNARYSPSKAKKN